MSAEERRDLYIYRRAPAVIIFGIKKQTVCSSCVFDEIRCPREHSHATKQLQMNATMTMKGGRKRWSSKNAMYNLNLFFKATTLNKNEQTKTFETVMNIAH